MQNFIVNIIIERTQNKESNFKKNQLENREIIVLKDKNHSKNQVVYI